MEFSDFGLAPEILRAIEEIGYQQPTDIQAESIPLILAGKDIIGRSQTGTGKTAAFALPAVEILDTSTSRRFVQVLIPVSYTHLSRN